MKQLLFVGSSFLNNQSSKYLLSISKTNLFSVRSNGVEWAFSTSALTLSSSFKNEQQQQQQQQQLQQLQQTTNSNYYLIKKSFYTTMSNCKNQMTQNSLEQENINNNNKLDNFKLDDTNKSTDNPDSLLKNFKNLENENKTKDPNRKPSIEQLMQVKEKMTNHLPKFLTETHPYSLYTVDVIFENFYKEPGKVTVGAFPYALELFKLRWKINMRYSNTKIDILKITHDDKDGTVKIRWRLRGVRGYKSFITPWKFKIWKLGESIKAEAEWHDGFSILYVRGDGLIYKHRLQRVMSQKDEETVLAKNNVKNLATNLDVGPTICSNKTLIDK